MRIIQIGTLEHFAIDLERELGRMGRKIDEERKYTRYGRHEGSGEERDQPH